MSVTNWTLPEIVEQLKSCGYVCEAGPLENNEAFMALERKAHDFEALERIAEAARHYVQAFEGGEWALSGGRSSLVGLLHTRQAREEALKTAIKAWEAIEA